MQRKILVWIMQEAEKTLFCTEYGRPYGQGRWGTTDGRSSQHVWSVLFASLSLIFRPADQKASRRLSVSTEEPKEGWGCKSKGIGMEAHNEARMFMYSRSVLSSDFKRLCGKPGGGPMAMQPVYNAGFTHSETARRPVKWWSRRPARPRAAHLRVL